MVSFTHQNIIRRVTKAVNTLRLWPNFWDSDEKTLRESIKMKTFEKSSSIHFIDLHCLSYFVNRDLSRILSESKVVSDGKFVFLLSRLFGVRSSHIRGIDFLENTIQLSKSDQTHFFLGGSPGVLDKITIRARGLNPDILISGTYSPPFTTNIDRLVDLAQPIIDKAGADLVWVGLGAPKQILFASKLENEISGVCVTVGAAFDFFAGEKKAAPKIVSDLGLEWIFRICVDPKRLLARYLRILFVSPLIITRIALGRVSRQPSANWIGRKR